MPFVEDGEPVVKRGVNLCVTFDFRFYDVEMVC